MVDDLDVVGVRGKVAPSVRSCHTATVEGYVVEGHVPAAVIQRLVRERPDVVGIGVAGMPAGSPGMESPVPVAYDVLAWRRSGRPFVYATVAANGTAQILTPEVGTQLGAEASGVPRQAGSNSAGVRPR